MVSLPGFRLSRGVWFALFVLLALALLYRFHPALPGLRSDAADDAIKHAQPAPSGEPSPPAPPTSAARVDHAHLQNLVQYFTDYPLQPPYKDVFGELGRRTRIVADWLVLAGNATLHPADKAALEDAAEQALTSMYPFLQNPPKNPSSRTPFADLRASFRPGSAGIVIPTGDKTLRFAAHLIGSLRSVLGSSLPIQIAYAGDGDLAPASRARLAKLAALEFLDLTTVFDGATLRFDTPSGGWASKAFAALASPYETVILADADAVFLQPPEALLRQPAFARTGAYLFHDRLLWQHAFAERHAWWRAQIRRPSAALGRSLVWTRDYAEEADSGVVVVDKARAGALPALLHVCWQNSFAVREEATYQLTYGDKESWWFGFELAGAAYEFEKHYGAIVGWEERDEQGRAKVCSFVIAHVDDADKLLWYNGGLLKNKVVSDEDYEVPLKWMIDAEWQKGASKKDMSCMVGGEARNLTGEEVDILRRSIELAKQLDGEFRA
ncbi:62a8f7d4-c629-42d4-8d89-b519a79487d4 [Thermothielavioides terrestris]|uniref:Glycosyltransferase family 71 protein n=2 Tax=Thermothielavioides terrestris TaxID=2587410 RepID=G2R9G9_THETT|nr:glycosyltransferase family 71 protein [Thermothielavioides terrestris NRRL 8126]AEO68710.1 glycosyltransferase family 71 protein [Thermothielavioides terrestris NRRL 8126]SPQ23020.1 62a8f7d4-c629-42d4-8d89-b519a79487d4 [Thermothielavioides terrestris]